MEMTPKDDQNAAADEIEAHNFIDHDGKGGDVPDDEPEASWSELCTSCKAGITEKSGKDWAISFARFVGLVLSLYAFLFSLDLMGSAFKVVGGCSAGGLFEFASNPIAGLMVGILATVLVQSSSTSTSIVVSLVGSGSMSVTTAVPVIMGANIGTSVTNTIVSIGQIGNSDEYERAFAGATVHDMFNFLSVLILLPVEVITKMLERLTYLMVPSEVAEGDSWEGPIKKLVDPLVKMFLNINKDVTKNIAKGKYTCEEVYADMAEMAEMKATNETAFEAHELYLEEHNKTAVVGLIKGGALFTEHATLDQDMSSGYLMVFISLVLLCVCLMCLVTILQQVVFGTSERMLRRATKLNPYVAMLVGVAITILVQSSSITTSVLTPLVGVGVLPLEQMYPLTLGANIGTTATALLGSLVSTKPEAVQIALCHLFFNLIGILIWFPIPFMRKIPLDAARGLGALTRRSSLVPLYYILFAFVLAPLALLGLSSLFDLGKDAVAYKVLGIIIAVFLVAVILRFVIWWTKQDGKKKTFAKLEDNEKTRQTIKALPDTLDRLEANQKVIFDRLEQLKEGGEITQWNKKVYEF